MLAMKVFYRYESDKVTIDNVLIEEETSGERHNAHADRA